MKLLLNLVIFILIKSQCCNFLRFHLACLWNFSNLRNYTCRHEVKNSRDITVRSLNTFWWALVFWNIKDTVTPCFTTHRLIRKTRSYSTKLLNKKDALMKLNFDNLPVVGETKLKKQLKALVFSFHLRGRAAL